MTDYANLIERAMDDAADDRRDLAAGRNGRSHLSQAEAVTLADAVEALTAERDGAEQALLRSQNELNRSQAARDRLAAALDDAAVTLEHADKWFPTHPNYYGEAAVRAREALAATEHSR